MKRTLIITIIHAMLTSPLLANADTQNLYEENFYQPLQQSASVGCRMSETECKAALTKTIQSFDSTASWVAWASSSMAFMISGAGISKLITKRPVSRNQGKKLMLVSGIFFALANSINYLINPRY